MNTKKLIPNILSVSRIVFGVCFFLIIIRTTLLNTVIALILLIISLMTDYWDGKLARRNKTVSMVGKWIDPFSDFVFFFFVYLSFYRLGLMPLILLILFLIREISMYSIIRPLYMRKKLDPGAKMPGKIKTVMQITGSIIIILCFFLYLTNLIPLLNSDVLKIISVSILILLISASCVSLYWYIKPLLSAFSHNSADNHAKNSRSLVKTIVFAVTFFLLFQSVFFSIITFIFKIEIIHLFQFLSVSCVYHTLFCLLLILVRKEFYLEPVERPLNRLNAPLILSFLRFSSVPTILFLLIFLESISVWGIIIPFTCLIFLTDLFDGLLARRLNQTTRIGRMLDSSGDYMVIVVISILYFIYQMIPVWFFILVMIRLLVQCLGIILLYSIAGYSSIKRVSFLGKASIFATMTLYAFELMKFLHVPILGNFIFITILEIGTGIFIALSLVEKLIFLSRSFLSLAAKKEGTLK